MFRKLTAIEIAEGALLADIGIIFQLLAIYIPIGKGIFHVLTPIVFAIIVLRPGFYVVLATGYPEAAAKATVGRLSKSYPTAYVRLLAPAKRASAVSSRRPCLPSPSAFPSCTPSSRTRGSHS